MHIAKFRKARIIILLVFCVILLALLIFVARNTGRTFATNDCPDLSCGKTAKEKYWLALGKYFNNDDSGNIHKAGIMGNMWEEGQFSPTSWECYNVMDENGNFLVSWDYLYNHAYNSLGDDNYLGVGSVGITWDLSVYLHWLNDNAPELLTYLKNPSEYSYNYCRCDGDYCGSTGSELKPGDQALAKMGDAAFNKFVEYEVTYMMEYFEAESDAVRRYKNTSFDSPSEAATWWFDNYEKGVGMTSARPLEAEAVYSAFRNKDFTANCGSTATLPDSFSQLIINNDKKYIDLTTYKDNIAEFEDLFETSGYSVNVDTKSVDGKNVPYTGGKTVISSGNQTNTYTNVIYGDLDGDGKITSADYGAIRKHIMDTNGVLRNEYEAAGDIDKSGTVDIVDYVRLHKIVNGVSSDPDPGSDTDPDPSEEEYPQYYQCDGPWASYPYSTDTICHSGCGAASMAMLATVATGQDIFPDDIAEILGDQYYDSVSVHTLDPIVGEYYGFEVILDDSYSEEQTIEKFRQYLNNGYMIHFTGAGCHPGFQADGYCTRGHVIGIFDIDEDDNVTQANSAFGGNQKSSLAEIAEAKTWSAFTAIKRNNVKKSEPESQDTSESLDISEPMSVSVTNLTMKVGDKKEFSVSSDTHVGKVTISAPDNGVISITTPESEKLLGEPSDALFVGDKDNPGKRVIEAKKAGTATIVLTTSENYANYATEEIGSGTTKVINVTVKGDSLAPTVDPQPTPSTTQDTKNDSKSNHGRTGSVDDGEDLQIPNTSAPDTGDNTSQINSSNNIASYITPILIATVLCGLYIFKAKKAHRKFGR